MARAISRSGLIRKLDQAFSRHVRKNYADFGGYVSCVTCGKRMPWTESQAGHYIKRGHSATRWHPMNVHPQCPRCNLYLGGAQDEYARFLIATYGVDTLEELMRLKHTTVRHTMSDLRSLLERYQ